jgi:hypothetical protein
MTTSRRTLLRMGGLAVLGALHPVPVWARRERILEDAPDGQASAPVEALAHSPLWRRTLESLRVGAASRHGGLGVLWIHGTEPAPPLDVATLDEARASGALLIAERDRAAVPELVVENRSKTHVLLLAGEILVGGKQNRVLREDILLPPLSGPRALGVYCVEQGRWNDGRRDFESKQSFAQPGLRRQVYDKADQSRVWSEVARSTGAAAAPSPTGSYQQVYEQPAVRQHLEETERGLDVRISAGAIGAAVFVGASFSGLDVFREPALFAREWRKLLRAYAVEAYAGPSTALPPDKQYRAEVERLLSRAAVASGVIRSNVGVGQIFEVRLERFRGAALSYEGGIVHAAIL